MLSLWENAPPVTKLHILENESSVSVVFLLEDDTLITMIKRGDSQEDCLTYINENF